MNQKNFNSILKDASKEFNSFNQLLYQILILIIIYNIFARIENIKIHKSFIYLVLVISIILDLGMWNNYIQSSLFIAIIIIYSSYNFNKSRTVDLFINTMNNTNLKYKQHKKTIKENYKNELETNLKNENDIKEITFIPKHFNNNTNNNTNNNNTNTNVFPEPYTKYDASNNQINIVYKGTQPNTFITDSHYAQIMLNELYNTYNYKNIDETCLDKSLDNNINNTLNNKINNINNALNKSINNYN